MKYEVPKKKITLAGLKNLGKLYKYLKPYRITYAIGILFLLGSSLASLAFPKFLGDMVNSITEDNISTNINRIIIILGAILVSQAFFSYFRIVLFVNVTEKTLSDLRQSTYNHLIRLPLHFFNKHRVGELNSRISADISLMQDTMTSTLAEFTRQIIVILGGLTYMIITYPKWTLFMLAIVPVIMLLVVFFGRYIRKLSKQAQNSVAESNVVVEETLQGIQSVKVFTNELFEIFRYKEIVQSIAKTNIKNGKLRAAFSSSIILGIFGALIAIIWRGAALVGKGELLMGDFVTFIMLSILIGGTIGGIASIMGRIQQFIGATEGLFELFDEKEENLQPTETSEKEHVIQGNINIRDLHFSYPLRDDIPVLIGVNAFIPHNKTTAIVGPSGAGKSTLISLLLRLYNPTQGQIVFDKTLSKEIPLISLRKQIALVPQDIFLFGGTIRENIGYGNTDATEEMIIDAARKANALSFIEQFPEGFDTLVGERGTQLSGGQRQRIAIARAVLKDPKILMLDEATSSLDSESERLVQDALEKLMKGRTSIVIAHRLSTIRKADNILVFEKGKIVEQGTHKELSQIEGGIYKNLNELQFSDWN